MLLHLAHSPVTRLHRAIAVRYASGARAAMAELDDLAETLGEYHLYHASRAELLREPDARIPVIRNRGAARIT